MNAPVETEIDPDLEAAVAALEALWLERALGGPAVADRRRVRERAAVAEMPETVRHSKRRGFWWDNLDGKGAK